MCLCLGQYGPAAALVAVSYTGCDKWLTVILLTIGVGLNGGIYSGFKVNHLDISPQFAGILMSFTNCLANLAGLLAPIYAGNVVVGIVSIITSVVAPIKITVFNVNKIGQYCKTMTSTLILIQ